jgi:peptidoglycan/LPS O-acetylase OafA/YrhL
MIIGIDWLADKLRIRYGHATPWSGMIILAAICVTAYLADMLYDKPVRAWLSSRVDRVASRRTQSPVRS